MMEIKNIQTPEQLLPLAETIHEFLKQQVHTDDIDCAIGRGHELTAYMANTGKMLADARYWKDKAMSESIIKRLGIDLPASTLNELVKAECKDINYLVNWIEQLDKETKHQLEWLRTCVSKEKAQMYMQTH